MERGRATGQAPPGQSQLLKTSSGLGGRTTFEMCESWEGAFTSMVISVYM